jgi:outer membrane protein OmpA-like peptidoglycan-associated protein
MAEHAFHHDFVAVRVHDDRIADRSAAAVNAAAYTVGADIVFSKGRYSPATSEGRSLLHHELTHVVQQGHGTGAISSGPIHVMQSSGLEAEADSAAAESSEVRVSAGSQARPLLQRKLVVAAPATKPAAAPAGTTNEGIVNDYLSHLCPGAASTAGTVAGGACPVPVAAATPEACGCICDLVGIGDTWTINVDDADWPHTDRFAKTVTAHSPYSGVTFGSWAKGPPTHRSSESGWLVLGHEMCGHARLFAHGTHPTGPPDTAGGRPSHNMTVGIENKIAAEHGIPPAELRGLFADPHHGESFARVTISKFPFGSKDVTSLPAAEKHQVDIAEAFIKSSGVKVEVVGHADQPSAAGAGGDLTASQTRADNVKAELVSRGIGAGRFIASTGIGATDCPVAGHQPACRKVDVFMFNYEGASVTRP